MISKIILPKGFVAAGINSGVRKYRPDVGVIVSHTPCSAAGTFTTNSLKAWPVLSNMARLPSENIRMIVVNSGQANVATGEQGRLDNDEIAKRSAAAFGDFSPDQVLIASTGVIGDRIDIQKVLPAIDECPKHVFETINNFALAIMTTDLVPKAHTRSIEIGDKVVTMTGASKGSGMIHPNMATMLGFVVSDIAISSKDLDRLVKVSVDDSFNMISVDGETSTNDMVLALCNGQSGVRYSELSDTDRALFDQRFHELLVELSKDIARDGEGASKLIEIQVSEAPTRDIARSIARLISTSPLVKSAIHGEDPNWGRILARTGMSGVDATCFQKLELKLQGTAVFREGSPVEGARTILRETLKKEDILIELNLRSGAHGAKAWGCDLTRRYVDINTAYS